MEDHVRFSSIGILGELYYIADKYAVEYFEEKNIIIEEGIEFDYTVIEDQEGSGYDISNIGIN